MTNIRELKSEIEDLEITMDEGITIRIWNPLDSSFTQFLGILSHEARDKDKLITLENLAKSLENEGLRMNNHNKATANYAKRFIREKGKSAVTQIRDSEYSTICPSSKYKFCEKENGSNGCWQLQTECHFRHYVGHIAKFCKKKSFPMTSPPKNLITCT